MGKFPKIGEFTDEELTAWLNTLDIFHSTAGLSSANSVSS